MRGPRAAADRLGKPIFAASTPGDLKSRQLILADDALVSVPLAFDAVLQLVICFRKQSRHLEALGSGELLLMTVGQKTDGLPDRKLV